MSDADPRAAAGLSAKEALIITAELKDELAQAAYRVEGYADPLAFLAEVSSFTDGCIVLDLDMPGLNGLQVQSRLVELGCKLPVIFYSGKAVVRDAVGGMRGGAADFLRKGSDVGPLLVAIQKQIGPSGML